MAKLNLLTVVLVAVVIFVIIIIIAALVRAAKKPADSKSKSSGSSESSCSSESSDSSRHHVNAAPTKPNYRSTLGQVVQAAPPSPEERPPLAHAAFPRNLAKADKPTPEALAQLERNLAQNQQEEVVEVSTIADLFSPKEDLEADLGVDAETFGRLVEQYKKSKEYTERRLPVNRHFNLDSYNESKKVLRESAINTGVVHASKRGNITKSIYKKYGKHFTSQRAEPTGDVMSVVSNDSLHQREKDASQARSNPGHLVVRN